jgi:hypothetical protein
MATRTDPVSLGVVGREEGNPDGGKPESPEHLGGATRRGSPLRAMPKRVMLAVGFGLRRTTPSP